jgi:hypothetical protein
MVLLAVDCVGYGLVNKC